MSSQRKSKRKSKKDTVTLHLRVKGATALPKVSMFGSVDAFLHIRAGGQEFETQ